MSSVNEAINHRQLGVQGVAAQLDRLSIGEVTNILGLADREIRRYGTAAPIRLASPEPEPPTETGQRRPRAPLAPAWDVGQGRPDLATDDPAEVVTMNLCVLARTPLIVTRPGFTERHPSRCGWCDFDLLDLQAAIAHALYFSRLVVDHLLVWVGDDGGLYIRQGEEQGHYQNQRWEEFAGLHAGEQRHRVDRANEAVRQGIGA